MDNENDPGLKKGLCNFPLSIVNYPLNMRILLLTPWVPFPVTGACQQDRFFGMQQMKSLGYDIQVVAKIHDFQPRPQVEEAFRSAQIPLTLVPHLRHPWALLLKKLPAIIRNPGLLDGAALEYLDPEYLKTVTSAITNFKPDVLWIEYCTHWPLLKILKPYDIPTIVKSSLNEPRNCIDEHGGSLLSHIKALPKYVGERTVARNADLVLAISPDEEQWYRSLGAKKTGVLPLRGLAQCFVKKNHEPKDVLDVVFLSSNYNMGHNRDAFFFLLSKILPQVRTTLAGRVRFHLTGSKFPEQWKKFLADDLRHTGFVPDIGKFLATMDAALCPWISGQGMQQKVFEPLCRSLPLLTTKTAGYPFENGKEVLLCKTPEEYVAGLALLLDHRHRNEIASAAFAKARSLFSEEAVKKIMKEAVESVEENYTDPQLREAEQKS